MSPVKKRATKVAARRTAKKGARKAVKKTAKRKSGAGSAATAGNGLAPLEAPGGPKRFRARVRMYRHGLGDCFLITFLRKGKGRAPFHMLVDCGALSRDKAFMTRIVEHVRDTVKNGHGRRKARLDVVVATHEHKDHLSGFNQARDVFSNDFDFGAVWLGWTENLTKPEIKKIKEAKRKAVTKLQLALANPAVQGLGLDAVTNAAALLEFSSDDDKTGTGRIADALAYLKQRGKDAGDLQYLEPGQEPFELDGVEGVRVYVLGPPRDPILLKGSEVTERMKQDGVIYHLSRFGDRGVDALSVAVSTAAGTPGVGDADRDRYHPFAAEHRIPVEVISSGQMQAGPSSPYFDGLRPFVDKTYDDPKQKWRRIDHDWLTAFGQLALDLDNDTNNTSLVLAFEFVKTREVLLFVGDAQVGNWQSWAGLEFRVPGRERLLPAHDLLSRTVFYKVGHHGSHNATLRKDGLELMTHEDLVAFIPLDQATAKKMGTKGWEMPAPPLFRALKERTANRLVMSDVTETVSKEALRAGVIQTNLYVDYFLR